MIEMVLGAVAIAIPVLQGTVDNRRSQRDAALSALYMALTETQYYVQKYRASDSRDLEIERQLAALWFQASVPLRHFDRNLADLCQHKRDYWINPETWTADENIQKQIKLEAMQGKFDELRQSVLTAFIRPRG